MKRTLAALAVLATVAVWTAAQDAPSQPSTEPSTTQPSDDNATYEATLKAGRTIEYTPNMLAWQGAVRFSSMVDPGTFVNAGDVIYTLRAPGLNAAVQNAERALEIAQKKEASIAFDRKAGLTVRQIRQENLKLAFEKAQFELNDYQQHGRAEAKRKSELRLESTENSIKNQEEELAQLDRLYKGNDLAKESQDIVLNRARRRLAVTKENYAMQKRAHENFVKRGLDERLRALQTALAEAQHRYESGQKAAEIAELEIADRHADAIRNVEKAQENLDNLKHDQEMLQRKASSDGYVFAGNSTGFDVPFTAGQALVRNPTIATQYVTATLAADFSVNADDRTNWAVDTVVTVKSNALEIEASGKVIAVHPFTTADGKTRVRVLIDNADGKLPVGLEVDVYRGE